MTNQSSQSITRAARMLLALKKRWFVVIIAGLLAGVAAFGLSATVPPAYQAEASMFFSLRDGNSGTDINQGLTYTQNQMLSYAELATTSAVLNGAAADLGGDLTLNNLRRSVSVVTPQNTVILDIKVQTTDRNLSARAANSVADSLLKVVAEVAPRDTTGKPTVVARIIQPAVPAKFQASPNKAKNAVLGAFIGAVLALLWLFLTVMFDTRIRSVATLKSVTDQPLLGTAERTPRSPDQRPVALRLPRGSATEKYRQIRAALRFTSISRELRTVVVTSSLPGEGKTLTALNLALTLAEGTQRVLLIDADLRRPRIATYLGLEPTIGLTTVLVSGLPLSKAVQHFADTNMDVLTAGAIPPNPSELLDSRQMKEMLAEAKKIYDIVLIDTAPVLSVSDAAIIAQDVDSTVIVIDSTRLRQAQLEQTTDTLNAAGAHIAGLILNRVKPSNNKDRYYETVERDLPQRRTLEEGLGGIVLSRRQRQLDEGGSRR